MTMRMNKQTQKEHPHIPTIRHQIQNKYQEFKKFFNIFNRFKRPNLLNPITHKLIN